MLLWLFIAFLLLGAGPKPKCIDALNISQRQNSQKQQEKPKQIEIQAQNPDQRLIIKWSQLLPTLERQLAQKDLKAYWIRVLVDGIKKDNVPFSQGETAIKADLSRGHDVILEVLDAKGTVIHRTKRTPWRELPQQKVDPASFDNFPLLAVAIPDFIRDKWKLDQDFPTLVATIGNENTAWVLKDESLQPRLNSKPGKKTISVTLAPESGSIENVHIRDNEEEQEAELPLDDVFIKGDPAFQKGQAFFWDEMFVALTRAWYQPGIAQRTIDYWMEVQKRYRDGVIPRNVRQENYTSIHHRIKAKFGSRFQNGSFENPNLLGWAAWTLYSLSKPNEISHDDLKRALDSQIRSLHWLKRKRTVKDRDGKPIAGALWTQNLGSGMDNMERGGGNKKPKLNRRSVWVDSVCQEIEMLKLSARMNAAMGDWAEQARFEKRASEVEAYLNQFHWDDKQGIFLDRVPNEQGVLDLDKNPTIAGLVWPLYSSSVNHQRLKQLIDRELTDKRFGGEFPFPALPMTGHPLYSDEGHYWLGGRWAAMATVGIQGLESSGRPNLSFEYTLRFLRAMQAVSRQYEKEHGRGTVFEFYGIRRSADSIEPIVGVQPGHRTRVDFVGLSGTVPIYNYLRHVVGLRPVPGFSGQAGGFQHWLTLLESSPLFAHETFLPYFADRFRPDQRTRIREGYLEWNLFFDPQSDEIKVKNIYFHGERIAELHIRKMAGRNQYEVTASSQNPFNIQVNQLFDSQGTRSTPYAMSPILQVGGNRPSALFTLQP